MITPPLKRCLSSRSRLPSGTSVDKGVRNLFPPPPRKRFLTPFFLAAIFLAAAQRAPAQDAAAAKPADPRETAVRQLIDRYFLTWSRQDIDRYGQCFLPQAAVQLVDPERGLTTIPLGPFLESQRQAHRRAEKPLTETAEKVDIRFETPDVARVVVYWKLVGGERTEYGYDHFTLLSSDGKWRIANLLFYAVEPDAKR